MPLRSERDWYRDAVIYQLHVKAFQDASGDGTGDFAGLTSRLEHVRSLGATAIWLLPFYPSPLRDDGYDIADYRGVHPAYGTLRDFRRFVREAHRLGLRVITELVVNHTSDQHPWFQRARRARPGTVARGWYVWSTTHQRYAGTRIIFTDTEASNWAWDEVAGAYYWHRFFSHQPDLNFANPRVEEALVRVMRFWLDLGVDGLRLDAVPYLCEREGTSNENLPETHEVIKRFRAAMDARYPDRMLLAEANQWPEDVLDYFGDGDECHMAFHFPLMPRIYMAVAQEDRHPITDIMRQTPEIPEGCQWAIFLRNHDELTLEMVTRRERDYLWDFYAGDRRMRLNLGIRRRLAPLVDGDPAKIRLLNSLLLSMPGTPVIYYGDEIGMGDNIYLGDRDGVRTPMQWSPDRNGGFSVADPARLYLPPIMDPVYGYGAVNVEAQSRNPASLLNWMRRIITVRKAWKAFGRGRIRFLYPGNRKVLAYLREHDDEIVLCVVNLSRGAQPVELDLSEFAGRVPVELIGRSTFPPVGRLPYLLTLPGHGFFWFSLGSEAEAPAWHEPSAAAFPDFLTLVVPQGWVSLRTGKPLRTLEREILPTYLSRQRWFRLPEGEAPPQVVLDRSIVLPAAADTGWLLSVWRTSGPGGLERHWSLPLAVAWETGGDDPLVPHLGVALGRVRQGSVTGGLHDAVTDEAFPRRLLELVRSGATVQEGGTSLVVASTPALEALDLPATPEVRRAPQEQGSTFFILGERIAVKLFRRVQPGGEAEVEVLRHLSGPAGFQNVPAYLGHVALTSGGEVVHLALFQEFVAHQGDGWTYTQEYLDRFLEEEALVDGALPPLDPHAAFTGLVSRLGTRVAELHLALADSHGDPAFTTEAVTDGEVAGWVARARDRAARARRVLEAPGPRSLELVARIQDLLGRWSELEARLDVSLPSGGGGRRTRIHGNLGLGAVRVVHDDFFIVDAEGEEGLDRRGREPPLRDVARLACSIHRAGAAAALQRAEADPRSAAPVEDLAGLWARRTVATLVEAWRQRMGETNLLPTVATDLRRILDLFVAEQALGDVAKAGVTDRDGLLLAVRLLGAILEDSADPGGEETTS